MDEHILHEAGLTKPEATIYLLLMRSSPATPPKLATAAGESRSNTYKLLDSLEAMGLVTRDNSQPKLRYWANNPAALLDVIKKKRAQIESNEKRFQGALPHLIDEYFKYSEQPSIRYFHGVDGIKEIYDDQLKDGQPVTFIHSLKVTDFFGMQKLHHIRNLFPKANIPRHVFSPDIDLQLSPHEPKVSVEESNKRMLLTRTWIDQDDLKSPVEWAVYGNKLAVTSLGGEVMGIIIESPQIAKSFREILALLDKNIRAQPSYQHMPKKLRYTKKPEIV